jgi:ribosomal protein S18 acetylase RimI-like enzyme
MERDYWLGGILGTSAYRVVASVSNLVATDLPQGECFLEARVDANDAEGLANAQALGFRVVDCTVTFERPAEVGVPQRQSVNSSLNIRFAEVVDEDSVRELAREAFAHNRFRRDPEIPDRIADKIKEEWAANFFNGQRGDWLIVAEDETGIVGFLQIILQQDDVLLVDLIAVASHRRRRGVASLMMEFSLRKCLDEPVPLRVGTQLSNQGSIKLYQGMGFKLTKGVYLLHKHLGRK